MKWIPLRVHSVFSRGQGGLLLDELAAWGRECRLPALPLTDVANLYGWAQWKEAAQRAGLRPVFGCELSLAGRTFLFLVKTREGYWNLMEILNRRRLHSLDGLVTIVFPWAEEPQAWPEEPLLAKAPREDVFIGAEWANFERALAWGRRLGRHVVWANPLKFIQTPQRLVLLEAIQHKKAFPREWARQKKTLEFFGPAQVGLARRKWGEVVESLLRRNQAVVEKCLFSFKDVVPPLPAELFSFSLREVVLRKLRQLPQLSWQARERARRELAVVEASGFAPYFLVVYDVVRFARQRGILHNLKGSGASSYLAYLLGISRANPLHYDLYFERFLNPGRPDPPDFDLDFDSSRRDEVLAYVLEKYGGGRSGAAFVCSLKSYRARSAVYETARAFGFAPAEARSLTRRLSLWMEPGELARRPAPPGCQEIWRLAATLQDVLAEVSLHVGGIILTPAPVERYLPLAESARGYRMSHFDRDAVEALKLIKLDLLSVRGLAAISATMKALRLKRIPLRDPATFRLLQEARTIGCFQVESPAMMNLLRRLKPISIQDLVQALALIRPGPTLSGMKEARLRQRQGQGGVRDKLLQEILPETAGLLLYEEQVMQVAERVAGFPPARGDVLRRALKRKEAKLLAELKKKFLAGGRERGYAAADVQRLWRLLEAFSAYSFNKAHSVSYALMAYRAAYLKAHYPRLYLTAVLNAGGGYYDLAEYIEEVRRWGIPLRGVDVNRSGLVFSVEEEGIRVGLMLIKGLTRKTARRIIEAREEGPFLSVEDFIRRVQPPRADLLALIKAGALDSLEPRRSVQILRYFQGVKTDGEWSDLEERQKQRMIFESLGFSPEVPLLAWLEMKRPPLRIKDLAWHAGREVELLVRVVDARLKAVNGRKKKKYFFLFEDETGLLEGVGEKRCLALNGLPVCYLRGVIHLDSSGRPRILDCSFASFYR